MRYFHHAASIIMDAPKFMFQDISFSKKYINYSGYRITKRHIIGKHIIAINCQGNVGDANSLEASIQEQLVSPATNNKG